jgi:hypothetical protein
VTLETDSVEIPMLLPDEVEGFVRSYKPIKQIAPTTLEKINEWLKIQKDVITSD